MQNIGGRQFLQIPGEGTHELPPLLVRTTPEPDRLDNVVHLAEDLIEAEGMIPPNPLDAVADEPAVERRRMDMAVNLVEQYLGFLRHWQWGDGVIEWIRQCETTFESRQDLRPFLRPDVWPHAGRSSFVTLLHDKKVDIKNVDLDRAVGMRLTFRQPPPISCFSNQFLFYLNSPVASSAFQAWVARAPQPVTALPPERFEFRVFSVD